MQNRKVRLQLDSGSDLIIITLQTWRKLNKPVMLKTDKIARSVTGRKIKFVGEIVTNVTFNGMTKKLKMYVLRNTENLFGTDWMQKFELWDLPISTYCQNVKSLSTEADKLKGKLKTSFPEVFSADLGRCKKMAANIKIKNNVQPIFKKKRSILFASIEKIDQELSRLENTGILKK